jgi:hypothetical protein
MHTKLWLENPKGKRLLVRPRRRWEYNIKLDLKGCAMLLVAWLTFTPSKMKAIRSSETLVNFYQITRRHFAEDSTLQIPFSYFISVSLALNQTSHSVLITQYTS